MLHTVSLLDIMLQMTIEEMKTFRCIQFGFQANLFNMNWC